jgi:hypothetical protein
VRLWARRWSKFASGCFGSCHTSPLPLETLIKKWISRIPHCFGKSPPVDCPACPYMGHGLNVSPHTLAQAFAAHPLSPPPHAQAAARPATVARAAAVTMPSARCDFCRVPVVRNGA